jgi:hypothetical protein
MAAISLQRIKPPLPRFVKQQREHTGMRVPSGQLVALHQVGYAPTSTTAPAV